MIGSNGLVAVVILTTETAGRLFVHLGTIGFSARIRNVGMEATVRSLVDASIRQRVALSETKNEKEEPPAQ